MSLPTNLRRIDLNLPLTPAATFTRRRFLAGAGVILSGPALLTPLAAAAAHSTGPPPAQATRVRCRLLDGTTGRPTPAMVCITNVDSGEIRLPPDGRVCARPSSVEQFVRGVKFDPGPNWIGPVRKTLGRGDNNDRSYVYEDRPSLPFWPEPVIWQTPGEFSIDLPAGRWRIRASHGMEFVPVTAEFDANGQGELPQTLRLERWIDLPAAGWWSGDVHVHHPSADPAHREFLLQYALAEDVHLVNLLEMGHHTGTEFKQAGFGPRFRVQRGPFALVSGQEDPRSTYGHIIGLNLQSMVRDTATYDFYDLAFRGIHAQPGALVGFAHFSWNGCDLPRGFPWLVTTGEIDFIELLQFGMVNRTDYIDYLNLGFRLTAAAGSDIPWGSTLGEVRTYVHTGTAFDVDAWFRNLKAGHTFVSNGPALEFTVDDALPGSELTRSPGARVRIRARARGHARIGLPTLLRIDGPEGVLQEVRASAGENELAVEFEHVAAASEWLMAGVVCDNGALAHTTPVYVAINGRPTWNPGRGPAIIDRQLEGMARIEAELAGRDTPRAAGLRDRLRQARAFYADLRARIGT